jgi:hypothetical protein
VALWYWPPGHAKHAEEPVEAEYVPAPQEVQAVAPALE